MGCDVMQGTLCCFNIVGKQPSRELGPVSKWRFNEKQKRLFVMIQVWLAALRETDKDRLEEHIICEDHFMPEDLCKTGVRSDAIPIMPPYLDGLMGSWSRDALQREAQWSPEPDPPKQVWIILFCLIIFLDALRNDSSPSLTCVQGSSEDY